MWTMPRRVASRHPTNPARPAAPILNYCQYLAASRIALSHFCYRSRKTLTPQGPRKLPKLDVAGSTPVARSSHSGPDRHAQELRGNGRGPRRGAVVLALEERQQLLLQVGRTPILLRGLERVHRRAVIVAERRHELGGWG